MRDSLELPVWALILLDEPPSATEPSCWENVVEDQTSLTTCLVLLAHGSRDPRWREPFERIYLNLRCELGNDLKMAYMEFIGPTLFDVAEECAQAGFQKLRILPLFMAAGAHLATDLPEQAQQLQKRYPGMEVEILKPIGEDPRMFALVEEIIRDRRRLC